jgi:hypothetical protein
MRLGETIGERRLALTDAGDTDGDLCMVVVCPTKSLDEGGTRRRGELDQRPERVIPSIEERARSSGAQCALERSLAGSATRTTCGRSRSQPRRAARLEVAARTTAGGFLEEVLIRFFPVSR